MPDLLVVDDDLDLASLLQMVLRDGGHDVRVAHDGREALTHMEERMPDAVVTDMEMPVLDGPSMAYRMLLHDCGLELVPVVLLSGSATLPEVATRVGTPYSLAKPFDLDDFVRLVERALSERLPPSPSF